MNNPGRNTREHCAWDSGRRAFRLGQLRTDNPHRTGTTSHTYWALGWDAAHEEVGNG